MGKKTTLEILLLSLPIMAGSILQQLYHTIDSMIVGRYVGEAAFAALGVAGAVMNLLIFLLYGVGIGMTVLLSQKYGSGDRALFRRTASTALCGGLLFSIALSVLCVAGARLILVGMQTPPEILEEGCAYLRIVFMGLGFTFLYNYHSAALLATGDSKTPFYALAISSLLNVILDLLLVAGFGMGTRGAAVATVASQAVSTLFCAAFVLWHKPVLAFGPADLTIDRGLLHELAQYSSASALQQSILYGGRLAVQGAVNRLGVEVIAGYNAACRIESFVMAPMDGVSSAASSYCAKKVGGHEEGMVLGGFLSGLKISLSYNVIVSSAVWLSAPHLIGLFFPGCSDVVLQSGVSYLRGMAAIYLLASFTQMLQGLLRGIGRLRVTIANSALQICFRVAVTYGAISALGVRAICLGTLAGWLAMIAFAGSVAVRYFRQIRHTASR